MEVAAQTMSWRKSTCNGLATSSMFTVGLNIIFPAHTYPRVKRETKLWMALQRGVTSTLDGCNNNLRIYEAGRHNRLHKKMPTYPYHRQQRREGISSDGSLQGA